MYLSVPIPNNLLRQPNLEQCVQEFTKEEILDNEDKWNCPRCRSQQRAKKKIDIWKLPSILIVHLKRFEFSETKKGKIKDFVDFPIKNLDLTPNVSKLQRDKPIYDLFAVCNHEGFLGGGHYYGYTKHRHNQSWYQFNDESISAVGSFKDVRKKCILGRQKPTTLFYERADIITSVLIENLARKERSKDYYYYFSDEGVKDNNFWTYGVSEKTSMCSKNT
jgi:ubiquitin C-terminal hydrolase